MEGWRRNQVAAVAATFVGFTGFTLVMPFLSSYIQELGVTDTGEAALWTGVTLGITPAIVALCSPLWGRVGDRFGNKLLVQRSLFSCVIVMALMTKATEPWQPRLEQTRCRTQHQSRIPHRRRGNLGFFLLLVLSPPPRPLRLVLVRSAGLTRQRHTRAGRSFRSLG